MLTLMKTLLPLLLLLLLPTACGRKAATASAPPPAQVTVVTLKAEPVTLTRELPGRTQAFLVAEVRPQVNGIVQRRVFTEGGLVEAGQPLYQLDDAMYRADFQRAEAALGRAQAARELARLNAVRAAELTEAEAVSRQEGETAAAALQQAEAEVRVAEAALAAAEVVLGYSQIRSPISGRIGRSSVTAGALVTANQAAPLATVQQLDPIYVDLTQSSRELLEFRRHLSEGTMQRQEELPVRILLEDGTAYDHEGRVAFSEVTVERTTGSFNVRVLVPNPDHVLLPGMYVRAVVGLGVREQAILVPQPAVARDARGHTSALVVTAEGKVEPRPLTVSRTIGNRWLVDEGLGEGDRVVVEGLQKIRPGMTVQATEAHAAAAPSTR
jgi:membrane fusion protein, multidrug efflux system